MEILGAACGTWDMKGPFLPLISQDGTQRKAAGCRVLAGAAACVSGFICGRKVLWS